MSRSIKVATASRVATLILHVGAIDDLHPARDKLDAASARHLEGSIERHKSQITVTRKPSFAASSALQRTQ